MSGQGDWLALDYCNHTNWLTKDSNSFCPLKLQPVRALCEKMLPTGTCRPTWGYFVGQFWLDCGFRNLEDAQTICDSFCYTVMHLHFGCLIEFDKWHVEIIIYQCHIYMCMYYYLFMLVLKEWIFSCLSYQCLLRQWYRFLYVDA